MPAEVQVDVDDGVMVVTVNRPQARNAITLPVAEAIAAAFDKLDASGELMAAIRASQDAVEGARAFGDKRKPVWHNR
jgi:enoyl-CoA hydratase